MRKRSRNVNEPNGAADEVRPVNPPVVRNGNAVPDQSQNAHARANDSISEVEEPETGSVEPVENGGVKRPHEKLKSDEDSDVEEPVVIAKRSRPETEELSISRQERLMANVMDCLYKDWHPLDPEQNPLDSTDFMELLDQFEDAWTFRRSMNLAFKKILVGQRGAISGEKAAIFALAIEQALDLDSSDDWNDSVFVERLYGCRTLDDFQQALWGCELINPGALMAKIYAWCHPSKLPARLAKEVSMESFWRDLIDLPFCGGECDPILLVVAKGCTWDVALRYGTHTIRKLMDIVPNWWKKRTPDHALQYYKDWFAETNMVRKLEQYVLEEEPKYGETIYEAEQGLEHYDPPESSVDPQALVLKQATCGGRTNRFRDRRQGLC